MHWKPVAYASCSLSNTERRYSQIEKEALAIAWACEKFANYVLGKAIHLETDHKPLVPLLNRTKLTPCQHESYGSDYASPGLITASATFQGSCSTLQTHFPMLQLPLPAVPISRRKHRQSSSQVPLFPPCQQAKIAWMSTGQLNKRTAPVASSSPSANRDSLTDPISREIFRRIGT